MAFFHLGNTRKRRGFSGLPIAASYGGRLFPEPAKSCRGGFAAGKNRQKPGRNLHPLE